MVLCPKDWDTLSFQPLLWVVLLVVPQLSDVPLVEPLETEWDVPEV